MRLGCVPVLGSLEIALHPYIKSPLLYNVVESPKVATIDAFLWMHKSLFHKQMGPISLLQ